ncbi:hypothetical protein MTR67_006973 [Solanum verrucosum]|uniref:Uncharacterized protein n=1 Tax=Solanum verrucosum TaxID=315347 RepID=A0AAF0PYV8_SOLVR|nr:hypothetical protein MTR67_006973 [Solanum verrucosum]
MLKEMMKCGVLEMHRCDEYEGLVMSCFDLRVERVDGEQELLNEDLPSLKAPVVVWDAVYTCVGIGDVGVLWLMDRFLRWLKMKTWSTTIGGGGSPDFEGELSLLEELGINTKQIYQKM